MTGRVLSEVAGTIAVEREGEFVDAYRKLVSGPLPEGLLRTELLRGEGGRWRVQSLWRDRAALEAVRSDPKRSAAPHLFQEAGAEPVLSVYELTVAQVSAPAYG